MEHVLPGCTLQVPAGGAFWHPGRTALPRPDVRSFLLGIEARATAARYHRTIENLHLESTKFPAEPRAPAREGDLDSFWQHCPVVELWSEKGFGALRTATCFPLSVLVLVYSRTV